MNVLTVDLNKKMEMTKTNIAHPFITCSSETCWHFFTVFCLLFFHDTCTHLLLLRLTFYMLLCSHTGNSLFFVASVPNGFTSPGRPSFLYPDPWHWERKRGTFQGKSIWSAVKNCFEFTWHCDGFLQADRSVFFLNKILDDRVFCSPLMILNSTQKLINLQKCDVFVVILYARGF